LDWCRYIVCGDYSLSYQLIAELGALPDTDVVVVSRRRHGDASVPERRPDVELINVEQLNEATFRQARSVVGLALILLLIVFRSIVVRSRRH